MKKIKENKNVVVKSSVILNLIQDLQRLLWLLRNCACGRFQIKFGMTPLFNKGAFTLIELLVVVLIIGILAAIAVSQYQKAVKRATYTRMIPMVQAIANAQKLYYLEHGVYASSFDELDLNIAEDVALTREKCGKWIDSDRRYMDGMCIGLAKQSIARGSVRVDLPMSKDSWNGYGYLLKRYNSKVPEGLVCMEARGGSPADPHCKGTFLYSDAVGNFYAME